MPYFCVDKIERTLNSHAKAVNGSRVVLLGVAYKPDVGDVRESPALRTMQALYKKGADVSFHDFFIEEAPLNGGTIRRVDLATGVAGADLVVLLTPHSDYDLEAIAERARLVFDTRNAYGAYRRPNVIAL